MFRSFFFVLLALLSALTGADVPPWGTPQDEPEWARKYGEDLSTNAIYFAYTDKTRGYVFGISATQNGDMYFHMAGPVTSSWVGVGFGTQMKDSMMIVAYPSANGLNTTTAVRWGHGHTEPEYRPDIKLTRIWHDDYAPSANTVTNNGTGAINSHCLCHGCAFIAGLDYQNQEQEFFFALGPNKTLRSDSPSANLGMHVYRGRFTGNMTHAVNFTGNYSRVPGPNIPDYYWPPTDAAFASSQTSEPFDLVTNGDDHTPGLHGFMMCFAFVIVFPFGTLVKLLLRKVLWHAAIQGTGVVLIVIAFAFGVKVSHLYNKSRDFTSGHQILGILILIGILAQAGLGLIHHSIFSRTKSRSPLGRFHILLGPVIMILGLINGGLGWRFAGNWENNIPYTIVVVVISAVFFGLIGCILLVRRRQRTYKAEVDYDESRFAPKFGYAGSHSSVSSSSQNNNNSPASAFGEHYRDFSADSKQQYQHQQVPIPASYVYGGISSYGAEPPTPYEPHTPYPMQDLPYEPPAPYAPAVPYTPVDAHMPLTPKTWKKVGVTEYALSGHEEE